MAPRLPYAVARSRSTALRPCGCPVSFGFRKKARQLAGEHRLDFSFAAQAIHTYLHFSYWNLVRHFHLIEKSISAYTFREQNSSRNRTSLREFHSDTFAARITRSLEDAGAHALGVSTPVVSVNRERASRCHVFVVSVSAYT